MSQHIRSSIDCGAARPCGSPPTAINTHERLRTSPRARRPPVRAAFGESTATSASHASSHSSRGSGPSTTCELLWASQAACFPDGFVMDSPRSKNSSGVGGGCAMMVSPCCSCAAAEAFPGQTKSRASAVSVNPGVATAASATAATTPSETTMDFILRLPSFLRVGQSPAPGCRDHIGTRVGTGAALWG